MLEKFLRWLKGYVVFCITGKFPERFINLCTQRGIRLFAIRPSAEVIYASMSVSDYLCIRHVSRRAGVRLKVTRRVGLPFLIHQNRNRYGLLAGMALFLVISLLMQNFVWSIDIRGVNSLSESALRESLSVAGLREGAYKGSFEPVEIERKLMQEFDDIGWMSVNLIGTKAEVEIKEKVRKPPITDSRTPCNIKASHDGLIEKMVTTQGTAVMHEGSAVVKGQLLVSAVMINALSEVDYVHASAKVMAKTERKETFSLAKSGIYRAPGESFKRHNLIFCFFEFPLTLASSGDISASRFETKKLTIDGTGVQFGIKTEVITPFADTVCEISSEKAEEILAVEDNLYRFFSLGHCEEIAAVREIRETEESYECTVRYTCREDIAREEIFVVN